MYFAIVFPFQMRNAENSGMRKCLHIGRLNGKSDYKIQNAVLNTTANKQDVGVTVQTDLKVAEQCGIAAVPDYQCGGPGAKL